MTTRQGNDSEPQEGQDPNRIDWSRPVTFVSYGPEEEDLGFWARKAEVDAELQAYREEMKQEAQLAYEAERARVEQTTWRYKFKVWFWRQKFLTQLAVFSLGCSLFIATLDLVGVIGGNKTLEDVWSTLLFGPPGLFIFFCLMALWMKLTGEL